MQKLTAMKNKFAPRQEWQDFDQLSDCFDLALSPEVIGWFHQQNEKGNFLARQRAFNHTELDEHELSLR